LDDPGSVRERFGRAEVITLPLDSPNPIREDCFEGELEDELPLAAPRAVAVGTGRPV